MPNEFPAYIFYKFRYLERFEMTHQHLKRIEKANFENGHNYHLNFNFSHNEIERITDDTFELCYRVSSIDLSHNQIEYVDAKAFANLRSIQAIYLQHNRLRAMEEVWYIPHLTTFSPMTYTLSDNYVSLFETGGFWLDLTDNPLTRISQSAFVTADILDLRNNQFDKLVISQRTHIIRAQNNGISELALNETDQDFPLTSLNLSMNSLTSLPELSKFTKLKEIDLSFNQLESFDAKVFTRLSILQTISFSHNKLKSLNFGLLLNTVALKYLDVSYNNLGSFRLQGLFPLLQELHIEGNGLVVFDKNMRKMAPKLEKIGLSDNYWNCDDLARSLVQIGIDQVVPVKRQWQKQDLPLADYTGNVMGVHCFDGGHASAQTGTRSNSKDHILRTDDNCVC